MYCVLVGTDVSRPLVVFGGERYVGNGTQKSDSTS